MNNKKVIIISSIIIAVLVLTIGITYSIFTTTKTSKNSNLVVGDIYIHYNETNQIKMENAMPTGYIVNPIIATQEYTSGGTNELSKCVDALVAVDFGFSTDENISYCKGNAIGDITLQQDYDQGYLDDMNLTNTFIELNVLILNSNIPYFEFTIDGKNTTKDKDIWYEIVLSKGEELSGKTRIKDNLLKFRLVEIKDNKETTVLDNKTYQDLTNKRIWVDTINKNTNEEINITYRLYMWISNDTVIGNINQDYTMEEWKNVFASIKVGVTGDFNEKSINVEVDSSCFTTETNDTGLTITDYDSSCGNLIIIPETIDGEKVTVISSNAFNNKNLVSVTIPSSVTTIKSNAFTNNKITSINVPDTVTSLHCKSFDEGVVKNRDMTCVSTAESCFTAGVVNIYKLNTNMTADELNKCVTYVTDNISLDDNVTAEDFCKGTGTEGGYTFQQQLDYDYFSSDNLTYFETNNIITNIGEGAAILNYDSSCGSDVIIPSTIQGYPVTVIGTNTTSVVKQLTNKNNTSNFDNLNNYNKNYDVSLMAASANGSFSRKNLTSVVIPDSVTTIGRFAFFGNQLTSVVIPDSVTIIEWNAFTNNYITSVSIPESVTYLDCSAFDTSVLINKSDSLTCK